MESPEVATSELLPAAPRPRSLTGAEFKQARQRKEAIWRASALLLVNVSGFTPAFYIQDPRKEQPM